MGPQLIGGGMENTQRATPGVSRAGNHGTRQDRRPEGPLKVKDIGALRVRLRMENRVRELALFNLGIDSKLRGCDLVKLKVRDVCPGDQIANRAIVMQQKTQRRSSSRSPNPRERRFRRGSSTPGCVQITSRSRAVSMTRFTSERVSTRAS